MRNARSIPESTAEFDYQKSVRKSEDKYVLKYLQINKYLNRPLASVIVRGVYRTRVTPNQLTCLAFLVGLSGAYFFFRGRPAAFVVGGVLAQLSSVVDCADGMLARAKGLTSEFGAYLDLYLDRVNEFFLLAGYMIGFYRYSGRLNVLILGLVTLGLYFLETTLFYLAKNYLKDTNKGETAENRGWFLFLMFLFALINRMDIGIYIFAVATVGINVFQTYNFFRLKRS
jgi:phosphatidylglycerophosphate synthase